MQANTQTLILYQLDSKGESDVSLLKEKKGQPGTQMAAGKCVCAQF